MNWTFWLILTVSLAYVSCQQYLFPWIASSRQLNITRSFLRSNCSALFNSTLSSLNATNGLNITLFAPTDEAWRSTFNMTDFTGFENLDCSDTNVTDCPRMLSGNLSALHVKDVAPCIPLMAAYHLVNGTYDNLYNCTDSTNITVIPSALNMTYDHGYQGVNMSQVIISHVTPDEAHVHSGGNSTAFVTHAYSARDGRVYLIDRVLIPPLFLNYTLNAFNMSQTLNTTTMLGGNQTFTIFLPISQANTTLPANATFYIIPQVFYLNQTEPTTLNLTALNGNQILLNVQQNRTVTLNGNVTIVKGNIPLVNGVLHLVNDTLGTANISNTVAAYQLRQNMDHWRHWIHNH